MRSVFFQRSSTGIRARWLLTVVTAVAGFFGGPTLADEIYWQDGVNNWFNTDSWIDYSKTNSDSSYVNQVPSGSDYAYIENGGYVQISNGSAAALILILNGGTVALSGGSLTVNDNNPTNVSEFVGNDGNGTFIQNNGANTTNFLYLGYSGGSNGSYALSAGTLTVTEANANAQVNEAVGFYGAGSFTQDGGANATGYLYIGDNSGSVGSYYFSGGILTESGQQCVGGFGGKGVFAQSGGNNQIGSASAFENGTYANLTIGLANTSLGTYTISSVNGSDPTLTVYGSENIGYSATGTGNGNNFQAGGTFNQSAGTNIIYDALNVGYNASATGLYILSGGSLTTNSNEYIGYNGIGAFTQTGGTNSAQSINIGQNARATGGFSLSGTGMISTPYISVGYQGNGEFDQSGGISSVGITLYVAENGGSGTFNLSGGVISAGFESIGKQGIGLFNQTGGTNTTTLSFYLGELSNGIGTYNLSNGSLATATEYVGASGSGTFTQSGGNNTITGNLTLAANAGSTGTYNLQGGTLTSGAVIVNSGGTLTNAGAVSLIAGTNTTTGNYNVQISGSSSVSFGQLNVPQPSLAGSVTVTFGGTTYINSANVSSSNDNYPILSAQTLSRTFKQAEAPATFASNSELAGLFHINYNYSNNTVSLNDFASVMTLANLCNDVYSGSSVIGANGYSYVQPSTNQNNPGYFANEYKSTDGKQIIVAFRGTYGNFFSLATWPGFFENAAADISFGLSTPTPALKTEVADAVSFVQSIETSLGTTSIILTGHSLGGAVAQMVGAASGLNAVAFDAPGAGNLYSSLSSVLQPGNTSVWLPSTGVNENFRINGDQVSLAGIAFETQVTLPLPTSISISTLSNQGLDLLKNGITYFSTVHSPNTIISQLSSGASPITASWQNDMTALESIIQPGLTSYPAPGETVSQLVAQVGATGETFDPSGGSDIVLAGQVGSPNFATLDLPNLAAVSSYNVRYEQNGVWSSFQSVQPAVMDTFGTGVTAVEFNAVDSSGNSVTMPQFFFDASFATNGTFTGTITETNVSESTSSSLWNIYSGGSWALGSNWSNLDVPQAAQDVVTFGPSNTAPAIITLDSSWTIGTINFASNNSYTLAPGISGSLTLDDGSSTAAINVTAGSHFISAPLTLNSSVIISVSGSGSALTISGSIGGAGGVTVASGMVTLSGNNGYSGPTMINAGKLSLASNLTSSPISVASGATLQLEPGVAINLASLSLATGSTLDITGNSLAFNTTVAGFSAATLMADLVSGYSHGAWNGTGIDSSFAAADRFTTLGYTISGTTFSIMYTWYGDLNLDGFINSSDLALMNAGNGSNWTNGDLNYDGVKNADDYALFMLGATKVSVNISTIVPEPVSAGLLAMAIPVVFSRKRSR